MIEVSLQLSAFLFELSPESLLTPVFPPKVCSRQSRPLQITPLKTLLTSTYFPVPHFVTSVTHSWYQNLYEFARAVLTKYYKMGDISNRNILSHSSRGQNAKIKMSSGLVHSENSVEESVSCLSPSFQGFAINPQHALACRE